MQSKKLKEILEEIKTRQYDNTMHQFDHGLSGRLKVLFNEYLQHKGDEATFIATLQQCLTLRLEEANTPRKKELFLLDLKLQFKDHPRILKILEDIKDFAQ